MHHHVRHRGRHDAALMRVGAARGECRRGRFEAAAQLRQRHQLGCAVAGFEPPPNHPGVEDIPLLGGLDGDADAAARRDQAHRLEHPDGLAGDAAGHAVLRADAFEVDAPRPAGSVARHDLGAESGQHVVVQSADV